MFLPAFLTGGSRRKAGSRFRPRPVVAGAGPSGFPAFMTPPAPESGTPAAATASNTAGRRIPPFAGRLRRRQGARGRSGPRLQFVGERRALLGSPVDANALLHSQFLHDPLTPEGTPPFHLVGSTGIADCRIRAERQAIMCRDGSIMTASSRRCGCLERGDAGCRPALD